MNDFDMNIPSNYYTGYNPHDDFSNEDREIEPFEIELAFLCVGGIEHVVAYVLCRIEVDSSNYKKKKYIATRLDNKQKINDKDLTQEQLYDIEFHIENFLD